MGTLTRLRFLIQESEMEDWEKKYWLDSIPTMTIKQCKKLLEIQEREYKEINEAKERFISNVAKIAFRY